MAILFQYSGLVCGILKYSTAWIQSYQTDYRHFDATLIYGTQEPLGEAIRRSGVPRKQFFICTKFPWNLHGRIGGSLNESLEIPGVDYVDLFLMRWAQYVVYESRVFPL